MMDIMLDVQVVCQHGAAVECQAAGKQWKGVESAEVGALEMTPAIKLAGHQLLAGVIPTHPPHATPSTLGDRIGQSMVDRSYKIFWKPVRGLHQEKTGQDPARFEMTGC